MRHLPTSWWLQQLGLPEYSPFLEPHFAHVEELLHLSEAELRSLGVRNAAHRAHILSSIRCLRAQVQRKDQLKPRAMQSVGGPAMLSRQASLGPAGDLIVGRKHHCHPQQVASTRPAQAYPSTMHGTLPRKRPVGRAASYGVEQGQHERSHAWPRHHNSLMHKSEGFADSVKFPQVPGPGDWSPERLKRELESELKLDSEDVRSHAWYHGAIPRQVAESQLERDGDFLVRDSLSGAGGLVLSCRWAERPLHFRVERRPAAAQQRSSSSSSCYDGAQRRSLGDSYAIQPGGDSFGSVPALVRFYVGNRQPVAPGQPGSGPVCVARPVNRTVPLAYLAAVHRDAVRLAELAAHGTGAGNNNNNSCSFGSFYQQERHAGCAGNHGAGGCCCGGGGAGGNVRGHQALKRNQLADASYRNGMVFDWAQDGRGSEWHGQTPLGYGTGADIWRDGLRRTPAWSPKGLPSSAQPCAHADPSCRPCDGPFGVDAGPAKHADERLAGDTEPYHSLISPQRVMEALLRDAAALRLESDVNAAAAAAAAAKQSLLLGPACEASACLGGEAGATRDAAKDAAEAAAASTAVEFSRPTVETESAFRPLEFTSLLLPPENKPLETAVLRRAKELQGECDVRTAARCIMLLDCEVARITGVTEELVHKMGVRSGLELLTLPHGQRLREDVIERFHALAIGLAVDVLGCTGCLEERAELLHRYVQLALELRGPLADLYGFSAVMHALMLPQVSRLERTWEVLRRSHTHSAIAFEKELKPFLLALQQGKVHVNARETSVPHLLPLVSLLEEPMLPPADPSAAEPVWVARPGSAERTGSGGDWEREWARGAGGGGGGGAGEAWEQPGDAGMDAVLAHLQAGREMARDAALYTANAERRLRGFSVEPLILETFRTEFHMRLYWGSRGCRAGRAERLHKFHHILSALSARLECTQRHSEL